MKKIDRYLIMHKAMINGVEYDCLYKLVCGSASYAAEKLAAAVAATGDRTMWLHLETEAEAREAWYNNPC